MEDERERCRPAAMPVALIALMVSAAALGACGGGSGGDDTSSNETAGGGNIEQVTSRLQAAGYVVSEDSVIAHQHTDSATGKDYRPEAAFTAFRPGTGVYLLLSVASDPNYARVLHEDTQATVIVRGDRVYALSTSGSGTDADLKKIVKVAEG